MLEEEKYILMKHVNMTYNDIENMSVYQRRLQIDILKEDVDKQAEEAKKQKSSSKKSFK